MAYSKRLSMDAIRTLAFGGVAVTYNAVGAAITDPARIIIFNNLTDANLMFSIDGVNDHFIVPRNAFKLIDITTNKVRDDGFFLADGTIFYVRNLAGLAPTAGNLYIEVIHA